MPRSCVIFFRVRNWNYIGMTVANLERSGFEVHDVEGWREHYARTCRLWHDNLVAHMDEAEREVGSVKTRLWIAYLAGCSIAFERSTLCIFQTLLSKRTRGPSGLPLTRADLYEALDSNHVVTERIHSGQRQTGDHVS